MTEPVKRHRNDGIPSHWASREPLVYQQVAEQPGQLMTIPTLNPQARAGKVILVTAESINRLEGKRFVPATMTGIVGQLRTDRAAASPAAGVGRGGA